MPRTKKRSLETRRKRSRIRRRQIKSGRGITANTNTGRPIIMPSIEDSTAGNVAALPTTLEMFDKFKQTSDNGKDSDSEESFHLQLDDDFIENSSVVSNGHDKGQKSEETEDEILNKFDTAIQENADHLDDPDEDIILDDIDEDNTSLAKDVSPTIGKSAQWQHPPVLLSNAHIKISYDFENYEDSGDGEFKSIYEIDAPPAEVKSETQEDPAESMEVADGSVGDSRGQEVSSVEQQTLVDCSMTVKSGKTTTDLLTTLKDAENPISGSTQINDDLESDADINMTEPSVVPEINADEGLAEDDKLIDEDVEMSEESPTKEDDIKEVKLTNTPNSEECALKEDITDACLISESTIRQLHDENSESVKSPETSNAEGKESTLSEGTDKTSEQADIKSDEKEIFKIPDELPKEPCTQTCSSDVSQEKPNDKTDDDEADLLDVSMIRETEEDDAFAIADAIEDTDKETQASEKSDEEQSERLEIEQESSDVDKDSYDNDNAMGFDDGEDVEDDGDDGDNGESSLRGVDGSSTDISENSKNKLTEISDSSKDSVSDSNSKLVTGVKASDKADQQIQMDLEDTLSCEEAALIINESVESAIQSCDTNKINDNIGEAKEDEKLMNASELEASEMASDGSTDTRSDKLKSSLNKRSLSLEEIANPEGSTKKARLTDEVEQPSQTPDHIVSSTANPETLGEQVQTLTSFAKFMQCRKLSGKLSRSDLEQFCIQKICESLMLKSSEGELHQTIKKHEKTIDNLRKDLQQLNKQCKDLEIVNKKLMSELKNQNPLKKAVMPLRITRSVGLQVRLNPGNEVANQNRRRTALITPNKQVLGNNVVNNRSKASPSNTPPAVVRQVLQNSPQKSPLTTGQPTTPAGTQMLSQALQKRPIVAKRTTPNRKQAEKTGNPGVIDLTDEDDKSAQSRTSSLNNAMKIISTIASPAVSKSLSTGKASPAKNTGKQVISKTIPLNTSKGNLSQGIRLTPTSVITSSANGSPQMLYVVPTITSNSNGQQKVAFVNFQPTNGMLSGSLNGSTVSVMSSKQGQTLTLKTISSPMRNKHPAPLPPSAKHAEISKLKPLLPKPHLTIKKIETGIILQWKMPYDLTLYENIASYQLYAYQETNSPPSTDMWRKVGDVKALALPMACTLTQFADKNKYFFAVRSVDVHKRFGAFSDPEEISL